MFGLPWDQTLGALMFVGMIAFLFLGFPVAFSLVFTGLSFGLVGFGIKFFDLLPLRVWGTMTNFTLTAVPLFVFMGVALEKSGLAEELLDTMGLLFGWWSSWARSSPPPPASSARASSRWGWCRCPP
jgi:TRAP-type mannitol/chloroaromatic compound transport system permease large subunit